MEEQRNGGTAKWRNGGTEEQRNRGTEERGNHTEEPRERKIKIHRNGRTQEQWNTGIVEHRNSGTQEQWNGGKGNKKLFLRIIVLTNFTNSYQSLDVLIGFMRMQIMKRLGIAWITIGCCEVNTNLGGEKKIGPQKRLNILYCTCTVHVPEYTTFSTLEEVGKTTWFTGKSIFPTIGSNVTI